MKILIVSDIHANIEALSAVAAVERPFDMVFCNGDIVDYGPSPGECIAWLRDHRATIVQGNHDRAVGAHVDCGCVPPFLRLSQATREVMWEVLNEQDQKWLADLPTTSQREVNGIRFYQCHAAPGTLTHYLPPQTAEKEWEKLFEGITADFVLLGHTHLQMDGMLAGRRFVNPGSVGQPKPKGKMAQYAIWQDGVIHLKAVSYDYQKTKAKIRLLPLAPNIVDQLCRVLEYGTLDGFR